MDANATWETIVLLLVAAVVAVADSAVLFCAFGLPWLRDVVTRRNADHLRRQFAPRDRG